MVDGDPVQLTGRLLAVAKRDRAFPELSIPLVESFSRIKPDLPLLRQILERMAGVKIVFCFGRGFERRESTLLTEPRQDFISQLCLYLLGGPVSGKLYVDGFLAALNRYRLLSRAIFLRGHRRLGSSFLFVWAFLLFCAPPAMGASYPWPGASQGISMVFPVLKMH